VVTRASLTVQLEPGDEIDFIQLQDYSTTSFDIRDPSLLDVINVYNVDKKFFVNAFIILSTFISLKIVLIKNHMSETKQNYDGKPSYSALRSNRSLIEFIGSRC